MHLSRVKMQKEQQNSQGLTYGLLTSPWVWHAFELICVLILVVLFRRLHVRRTNSALYLHTTPPDNSAGPSHNAADSNQAPQSVVKLALPHHQLFSNFHHGSCGGAV
jgi:hypothetical protein